MCYSPLTCIISLIEGGTAATLNLCGDDSGGGEGLMEPGEKPAGGHGLHCRWWCTIMVMFQCHWLVNKRDDGPESERPRLLFDERVFDFSRLEGLPPLLLSLPSLSYLSSLT